MRFLTNIYDPNGKNAKESVIRRSGQTHDEAWQAHLNWLSDKIIGEPIGYEKGLTSEALKEMGCVGVYAREAEDEV